jgi:hypothetical protein
MEPLCSELLLYKKKRQKAATSLRLPPYQQMDEEKPKCIPANPTDHQLSQWMHPFYQVRHMIGVQQHPH